MAPPVTAAHAPIPPHVPADLVLDFEGYRPGVDGSVEYLPLVWTDRGQ